MIVYDAFLSGKGAIQEVAGIDLDARFVGIDIEDDAGLGRFEGGTWAGDVAAGVEHPVVVVAFAVLQLNEIIVDAGANGNGGTEIHIGTFNGSYFAGGHEGAVYGSVGIGVDGEQIVGVGLGGIAVEVEIGMVCHVDDGGAVGFGAVADVDGIVVGEREGDFAGQITGEAFFAVSREASQFKSLVAELLGIEYLILIAPGTAMQAVAVVVLRQLIFHAIYGDLALIDAIGITADGGAEVRRIFDVILNGLEAQYDITHHAVLIRHHHRYDASAEVRDANFHATFVR